MSLVVLGPASAPVVTLAEAKAHMNVTTDDTDPLVTRLIGAAVAHLDGPRGLLGRCIAPTRLRLSRPAFTDTMELPMPPVRSIEAVTYTSVTGADVVLPTANYRVAALGADEGAAVVRREGLAWPWIQNWADAVRIDFTAGYDTVPEPLRAAILMHVAHLYENREASLVGISGQMTPLGYADLVAPFERWAC